MLVKYLAPAIMAIGAASAQSASTCTVSGGTTTINSQADATGLAKCKTVKGSVVVTKDVGGDFQLSGPETITGDLRIENNPNINSVGSDTLQMIGGEFRLVQTTQLNSINMLKLSSVSKLTFQSIGNAADMGMTQLNKVDEITISDSHLRNIDAINVTSIKSMNLDNNQFITKYEPAIKQITGDLIIQANGLDMEVSFPNLIWAMNMAVADVSKISFPSLQVVNGSARFDNNKFDSFSFPNLTQTKTGDISFVGNENMKNLTFPKLTQIGGGLLIANNTALTDSGDFPVLDTVVGAIKLRGNFTEAKFPKLQSVRGAFDLASTNDVTNDCKTLAKMAPTTQGGNGEIEGTFDCQSNNKEANQDTSGKTGSGDGVTGGSGSDKNSGNKNSGAAGLSVNAGLFLAAAGVLAQLLL
ncbi:cell wall protein Ecm33 [Neurospora sp. IMI 360204]|nr:cell wall protein Ecm33 [Neurospora sp. IMI 360204]